MGFDLIRTRRWRARVEALLRCTSARETSTVRLGCDAWATQHSMGDGNGQYLAVCRRALRDASFTDSCVACDDVEGHTSSATRPPEKPDRCGEWFGWGRA